jgi:chromate transporter
MMTQNRAGAEQFPNVDEHSGSPPGGPDSSRWLEVFWLFLRLGFTSFGGPAAHIGIMQNEIVRRRGWMDDQKFLDLIGVTNIIPGPNSTEMAIHIGLLRAGWPGLIAGGVGFIFPAFLIVLLLAWAYVRFGAAPQVNWLLYGIKPVVIAIILQALWQLGRKALKGPLLMAVGLATLAGYFLGVNEIGLLFGGGLLVVALQNFSRLRAGRLPGVIAPWIGLPLAFAIPFRYDVLFLAFLKIGAVLYGGGYVLLAFLRSEFVVRLGWLSEQQLLDAVAIGQFTPGPFFTTATFIGYTLGGVQGAVLATLGIFLPSFAFVALSYRVLARYQKSPILRSLLDGVNAAALGLMAAVAWQLGRASLVDPVSLTVGVIALLLIRYRINSTWLIAGGALVGLLSAIPR